MYTVSKLACRCAPFYANYATVYTTGNRGVSSENSELTKNGTCNFSKTIKEIELSLTPEAKFEVQNETRRILARYAGIFGIANLAVLLAIAYGVFQ